MPNNTDTLVAVLAGIAIGTGIGILYAPDKGATTRKKIKDGVDDVKKDIYHNIDVVSSGIGDNITAAKFDLEETYNDLVSNMSHKTEDIISFLEQKLADLKLHNAKLQK